MNRCLLKQFLIIQCKKCGHYGVGQTNKILKYSYHCKICNRTTKIKLKSKYGLNLKLIESFNTGLEAQKFLSKFNEEKSKDKFIGFKSYEV